ncbi:MAG: KOW domain-containing RNA-binding protein [Lachnospiraceae bacterium]|nr:KOW domain-containing RNA-binding protein [Lachnospiraceae bacterium]
MKTWTSGMLAVSLAGHDKGTLYVVLTQGSGDATGQKEGASSPEERNASAYVLLADGKHRTLDHPKRKKAKHIQVITHLPEQIRSLMREITQDAHVRKILKEYRAYQMDEIIPGGDF